jgi:hypothetical protein
MTVDKGGNRGRKSALGDYIFAFFHIFLLLLVLGYAVVGLFQRNVLRFAVIMAGLAIYYFLVLHKAVLKEIERKRQAKLPPAGKGP